MYPTLGNKSSGHALVEAGKIRRVSKQSLLTAIKISQVIAFEVASLASKVEDCAVSVRCRDDDSVAIYSHPPPLTCDRFIIRLGNVSRVPVDAITTMTMPR